jgi:hypothetical protein
MCHITVRIITVRLKSDALNIGLLQLNCSLLFGRSLLRVKEIFISNLDTEMGYYSLDFYNF